MKNTKRILTLTVFLLVLSGSAISQTAIPEHTYDMEDGWPSDFSQTGNTIQGNNRNIDYNHQCVNAPQGSCFIETRYLSTSDEDAFTTYKSTSITPNKIEFWISKRYEQDYFSEIRGLLGNDITVADRGYDESAMFNNAFFTAYFPGNSDNTNTIYLNGENTGLLLSTDKWYKVELSSINWDNNNIGNMKLLDEANNILYESTDVAFLNNIDSMNSGYFSVRDQGDGTAVGIDGLTAYESVNTAPVVENISTKPTDWSYNDSIDVEANVTDVDNNIDYVEANANFEGSNIASQNMTLQSGNTYTVNDLFTVNQFGEYNLTVTAYDTEGLNNTQNITQTVNPDNSINLNTNYNTSEVGRDTDLTNFLSYNIQKSNTSEDYFDVAYTFSYETSSGETITESALSQQIDMSNLSIGETKSGNLDITMTDLPQDFWEGALNNEANITVTAIGATNDVDGNIIEVFEAPETITLQPLSEGGIFEQALNSFYNNVLDPVIQTIINAINDIYNFIVDGIVFILEALIYVLVTIIELILGIIAYAISTIVNVLQYAVFFNVSEDYTYNDTQYDTLENVTENNPDVSAFELLTGDINLVAGETQADVFLDGTLDFSKFIEYNEPVEIFSYEFNQANAFLDQTDTNLTESTELWDLTYSRALSDISGTVREDVNNDYILLTGDSTVEVRNIEDGQLIENFTHSGGISASHITENNFIYIGDYQDVTKYDLQGNEIVNTTVTGTPLKIETLSDNDVAVATTQSGTDRDYVYSFNEALTEQWNVNDAFMDILDMSVSDDDYIMYSIEENSGFGDNEFTYVYDQNGEQIETIDAYYTELEFISYENNEAYSYTPFVEVGNENDRQYYRFYPQNGSVKWSYFTDDDSGDIEVNRQASMLSSSGYEYAYRNNGTGIFTDGVSFTDIEYGESRNNEYLLGATTNSLRAYNTGVADDTKEFFTFSTVRPKVFETKGLPYGTLALINLIFLFTGLVIGILPNFIVEGARAFVNLVSGVIDVAVFILKQFTDAITWALNDGFEWVKLGVYGFGIVKLFRWLEMLSDDRYTTLEVLEYAYDDVVETVEKLINLVDKSYRALRNAFNTLINVLNYLRDLIPFI